MTVRVRVRRHLDSETINIPELKELVGKDVEIVVTEAEPREELRAKPLRGSILKDEDPFGPASEDWEALD